MIHNRLKKILSEGKTALGTFVSLSDPSVVELFGLAGFDFVVLDNEHGPLTHATSQNLIRAAELRGMTPIVRIPNSFESTILHTLDVGAHGIQVPQVNDAETAKAIVGRAKYKPLGSRGIAFPRSADFGLTDIVKYFDHENKETMIVTHCENTVGLDNLEAICQIPEIDVIFLGPYDMSQSLGVTGQVTHPLVEAAAKKVIEVTKKYNKVAGIFAGSAAAAKERVKQGFRYITIGMDVSLFGAKCKEEADGFRS